MKEIHWLITNIASSEGERDLMMKSLYEMRGGL